MNNPKYRSLYILIGFVGLAFLAYDALMAYPDINPARVLAIAFPDLVVFFLAYRTYPIEETGAMEPTEL